MHLDRCIATNRCCIAICLNIYQKINGVLWCVFNEVYKMLWLINYLSIIKEIFDIVPRAVNAPRDKFPPPQLEQINTTIEHNRISLFDNVSNRGSIMIAVISQNASSAVHILLCKILEGEVAYVQ